MSAAPYIATVIGFIIIVAVYLFYCAVRGVVDGVNRTFAVLHTEDVFGPFVGHERELEKHLKFGEHYGRRSLPLDDLLNEPYDHERDGL